MLTLGCRAVHSVEQETPTRGTTHGFKSRLTGEHPLTGTVIQCNNATGTQASGGLITYVKKTLAARAAPSPFIGNRCDTLAIDITDQRGNPKLRVINTYAKSDTLDLQYLEAYAGTSPHCPHGVNVTNTDCNFATHVRGNKLDYTILLNDPHLSYNTQTVDELTSDHFAVTTYLRLPSSVTGERQVRKRLFSQHIG
ncbi:hypothetical protein E2C01_054873 [Portunus trituberculatus]|uniref:Endonuclease/exonuclease/phosphatase domain-containing protein n=1 Tax=Portunus trituberculatus TaxID=210409 RepID=A0A5B7GTC7_PORTR|nr:hypothetical protein [Portunus trituberculatus]